MQSILRSEKTRTGGRRRRAFAVALATMAILGVSVVTGVAAAITGSAAARASSEPVSVQVLTPHAGERTSSGFNVSIALQAQNARGNRLLSDYRSQFVDPTGPDGQGNPAFLPGASEVAPGLVVTLSTTPSVDGTPLVGPSTNLAGVFQINAVTSIDGMIRSLNDWQVSSPGFFGSHMSATLTVYAVRGTAPDAVPAGGLDPISNVVHRTFRIGA